MCRVLGVSTSGYYAWLKKGGHIKSPDEIQFEIQVKQTFEEKKRRYGSPRLWRELLGKGIQCGQEKVAKTMKKLGLQARKKKKYISTTNSGHNKPVFENELERKFNIKERNFAWLSDITYLPNPHGSFYYLCVVIDMGSKEVLGWHVDDNMEVDLVKTALKNAVANNGEFPIGTIFHSDQGSQFAAEEFCNLVKLFGMIQSMSRKGQCWDNAPMESFFSTLKTEYEEASWAWFDSLGDARSGLFDFIEVYYNRNRMHSSIDYEIPSRYKK